MKKDIHPKYYPAAKVFVNGEEVMTTGSTRPEIRQEIWSGNHPFYTGEQRIIDTAGQVDRFMKRLQSSQNAQAQAQQRRDDRSQPAPKKRSLYDEVFGDTAEDTGESAS